LFHTVAQTPGLASPGSEKALLSEPRLGSRGACHTSSKYTLAVAQIDGQNSVHVKVSCCPWRDSRSFLGQTDSFGVGGLPAVAVWRRRALELFPDLRRELSRRGYSVYSLFFDLKPLLREAFDRGDAELVRRIFGFAEWCAKQSAQPLWNAAGVSFYEHLFDYPAYSERMVPWLSPVVVFNHWGLWEAMVTPGEWARVASLLEAKRAVGERQARRL
jgi:hypothetical protein